MAAVGLIPLSLFPLRCQLLLHTAGGRVVAPAPAARASERCGVRDRHERRREAEEPAGDQSAEREERAEGGTEEAADSARLDERADVDGGDAHALRDLREHGPWEEGHRKGGGATVPEMELD